MSEVTREELINLAERRIWRVLVQSDKEFCGLGPSVVRNGAQARLDYLDSVIRADLTDDDLDAAPSADRDRAFGEAAIAMHDVMQMIGASVGQVFR